MTRIFSIIAIPAFALGCASCGCKQPIKTPELRSMPSFSELPSATEGQATVSPEEVKDVPVVPTK